MLTDIDKTSAADVSRFQPERKAPPLLPAPGKIRLVIDSDAKNEVDDQFAISWALCSPERFHVEAVYAAPFSHSVYQHHLGNSGYPDNESPQEGMNESYQEIEKLFGLLSIDPAGKIFHGSSSFLPGPATPVISDAARDLVRRGMSSDEPLYVAAIGAATDVASALLLEPRLKDRLTVVWLGGQPLHFGHGREFNLLQDVPAAQVLFSSGVPLVWIPCMGVASLLSLSDADIREKLLGKNHLCDYLAQIVLAQFPGMEKALARAAYHRHVQLLGQDDTPEDYLGQFSSSYVAWSRIIWDISTIAFLKNPGWVQSSLIPVPSLTEDARWITGQKETRQIRAAHYCQRDLIFGDLIACLTKAL